MNEGLGKIGRRRVVAMAVAIAASGLYSTSARGSVVGDWENGGNEGWFDWSASSAGSNNDGNPGTDPTDNLPSSIYSYSTTTGVTLAQGRSNRLVGPEYNDTQGLSLKTEYETDSEGNSEEADFFNNTEVSIDITYNSADWRSNTTFVNNRMSMNAQGMGFLTSGCQITIRPIRITPEDGIQLIFPASPPGPIPGIIRSICRADPSAIFNPTPHTLN